MKQITYIYSDRNRETLDLICLSWRRKAMWSTFIVAIIGLLISLINILPSQHIVLAVLILIFGINYVMYHRINQLLRFPHRQYALLMEGTVTDKYYKGDVLVADTKGAIPVLGQLFPKRWGKKMVVRPHYYIEVDEVTYIVDEALYNQFQKGDEVGVLFTPRYSLFLTIQPLENQY